MQTQTVVSYKSPLGTEFEVVKQAFPPVGNRPVKRISFVAGLHGNELEGVYICHRLIAYLRNLKETRPEAFRGQITVYPAVNPQAIGTGTRLWPFFTVDMNRLMGDVASQTLPHSISRTLLEDIKSSSDLAVDFHASNLHLLEMPQIRITEDFHKKLVPLALQCNIDVVWVHPLSRVFESTLGFNLNREKIPTLVVEAGICLRIHQHYCDQIFQGMVHLLHYTGILDTGEPAPSVKHPLLLHPPQVALIQARHSGLFVSQTSIGQNINEGDRLGEIVDPVNAQVLEEILAPCDGLLFTLRQHPLTYPGAPLARIAREELESS